jgi:preprotein translocase subunit SecB
MNASPLTLERYFFTLIRIEAHLDREAKSTNKLNTSVEVGQAVEDSRRYQVKLRLALMPPDDGPATYTGEVEAVGIFQVTDHWPEEKRQQLVETNGAALLYGAIREMVFNLTSRGPWPARMMPSVTFLRPDGNEKAATASPRASRKAKPRASASGK